MASDPDPDTDDVEEEEPQDFGDKLAAAVDHATDLLDAATSGRMSPFSTYVDHAAYKYADSHHAHQGADDDQEAEPDAAD